MNRGMVLLVTVLISGCAHGVDTPEPISIYEDADPPEAGPAEASTDSPHLAMCCTVPNDAGFVQQQGCNRVPCGVQGTSCSCEWGLGTVEKCQ